MALTARLPCLVSRLDGRAEPGFNACGRPADGGAGTMDEDEDEIAQVIRKMILLRGTGATITGEDVARRLAAKHGKAWRPFLKPVREAAVQMAKDGEIAIRKKGKPVDLEKLKGAYRIGRATPDQPCPPCPPCTPADSGDGDDR